MLLERLRGFPSQVEDTIVRDIIELGVDEASRRHHFTVNKTGERRPAIR